MFQFRTKITRPSRYNYRVTVAGAKEKKKKNIYTYYTEYIDRRVKYERWCLQRVLCKSRRGAFSLTLEKKNTHRKRLARRRRSGRIRKWPSPRAAVRSQPRARSHSFRLRPSSGPSQPSVSCVSTPRTTTTTSLFHLSLLNYPDQRRTASCVSVSKQQQTTILTLVWTVV